MQRPITRANAILGLTVLAGATLATPRWATAATQRPHHAFEVAFSDDVWRKRLTPEQFTILRRAGTEEPESSPLLREHRAGTFACAGCSLPVFDSSTKYDSGTGWPSFFRPLPNAIETTTDTSLFETRTEVHCRRCGGHLGHVFDDGPKPTGLRYCMNGAALTFTSSKASTP